MSTTKIITINEIVNLFKGFVQSHGQLEDFGYGPTSEISTSRMMKFPYLWLTHQSDSYIKIANKTSIPELKFVVLFMDQVNDQVNLDNVNGLASNNGQEIISDTFQYLQDCISTITKDWGQYGIMVSEDVRCFPTFDQTTDKVNGWAGEVTLKLSYVNCIIPS